MKVSRLSLSMSVPACHVHSLEEMHVIPISLVGHALAAVPDLHVQIRGGRARPRPSIDVLFSQAVSAIREYLADPDRFESAMRAPVAGAPCAIA